LIDYSVVYLGSLHDFYVRQTGEVTYKGKDRYTPGNLSASPNVTYAEVGGG